MSNYEKLLDANIGLLSKAVDLSQPIVRRKTRPLKAEFVRDDGAGGKFYGYRGRGGEADLEDPGKHHDVRIRKTRGRFGNVGSALSGEMGGEIKVIHVPAKTKSLKAEISGSGVKEKISTPKARSDQALDMGGNKVAHWQRDAAKVLGGEAGVKKSKPGEIELQGDVFKSMTDIENLLARLVEAEAQFLKTKQGEDYSRSYVDGVNKAKTVFRDLMDNVNSRASQTIVFDPMQNSFMYEHRGKMDSGDISSINKILAQFEVDVERYIKARTTAVRRALGSDE